MKINTQNLYQYIVTSTTRLNYFLANNSSWSKMLFVVLIYSTCVYFTKLLNFFDYYNLLAGIPAGLAFAIFVIWGTRLWQSIWVGTFAVDLLHNLNQVHDTESITVNIIAAFFTASGAVLQALIAAYFTKPFIKNSKKFLNIVKISAFLFKIGPIACLISTTIDMIVLYQFNALRGNAIMISWMSNYTLNILGIFLLTPIVIFYSRSNVFLGDGWRRRISIIIFSLFGTASLLLAGLFLINHDADRQSHYTFKEKSNEISLHANNLIKASQNQLRSIGALIKSNDRLDLSEFTRFNRNIEAHKGNITFSWISNEDFNQQSGVFRHQLIYPEDHMDDLLGKDIAQHVPRQALLFSMKTGRLALAKSTDSNKQIWWLIYPVFAGNSPDANPIDTYKLLGFAAAQINVRLFFEDLVSKADYLNSGLRITAMASWNSSATILEHNVPARLAPDNNLYLDNPVLVAEDNEINQKVIQRQLALLGVEADIASDGREALRLWKINTYALLLTDVHMPNMDGYQLTAAIREEETKANKIRMPIIALTANALKGEAEYCKKIGMDDYLSKPVQLSVLREKIKEWHKPPKMGDSTHLNNPEVASIDVNILKELVGDDQTTIDEILSDFLTSAARIASELHLACEATDCDRATRAAHKLKSSARSVGALRLGDLCQQIEQAGKNGKTKLLKDLFARFKLEMDYVNNYLIPLNRNA